MAAFNATSTLLNQILEPHGYTEDQVGIDGAILIAVGLVATAIISPMIDRYPPSRVPVIKICVLLMSSMYLALVSVPATRMLAAPYVVSASLALPHSSSYLLRSRPWSMSVWRLARRSAVPQPGR